LYQKSPFIDSIKVRLLSPCSKSNETFNDRNTAVGKAKSLGNTLRWISPTLFPTKWKNMVRDRFFQRMGPLLPDRTSGVYWHLLLPENLGGLGLWLETDIPDFITKLPDPSKRLIWETANGTVTDTLADTMKKFTTNSSYRGYTLLEKEVDLYTAMLFDIVGPVIRRLPMEEAVAEVAKSNPGILELSAKQQLSRLRGAKWLTWSEVEDQLARPFLFKEILSGEAKVAAFNTVTFKHRYSKLWDLCFNGHHSITEEDIRKAFSSVKKELFYDLSKTMTVYRQGRDRQENLIETNTFGLPDLKIRWTKIGELTHQVNETDFSLGEYV